MPWLPPCKSQLWLGDSCPKWLTSSHWQMCSRLCYVGLSKSCLNFYMTWQLTTLRGGDLKRDQEGPTTEVVVFTILTWVLAHHCFCHALLVIPTNPDDCGRSFHKSRNSEAENFVGQLESWLQHTPCSLCVPLSLTPGGTTGLLSQQTSLHIVTFF